MLAGNIYSFLKTEESNVYPPGKNQGGLLLIVHLLLIVAQAFRSVISIDQSDTIRISHADRVRFSKGDSNRVKTKSEREPRARRSQEADYDQRSSFSI